MEKIYFEISINAPAQKVYQNMIDEKHYKEWTSVFNATSHYKGSWEKGSKILFIGSDSDGNTGGMVSRIKENIPNKFISIEHCGILKGNTEVTSGKEVEGWAGSLENYTFNEADGITLLKVDLDSNEEFKDYFTEIWPKALHILKTICETQS
jgi:hypothetical protein